MLPPARSAVIPHLSGRIRALLGRILPIAAVLVLSACEPENISGEWRLTTPESETNVGRLLIQHTPAAVRGNGNDPISMDAELRGQRIHLEGRYWHGGSFGVVGRGCRAAVQACDDSVYFWLGHQSGDGRAPQTHFDAELQVYQSFIDTQYLLEPDAFGAEPLERATYLATKVR